MLYTIDMLMPSVADIFPYHEIPSENAPDVHELVKQGVIPSTVDMPMVEPNGIEDVVDIGSRVRDKFDAIDRYREVTGKPLANIE